MPVRGFPTLLLAMALIASSSCRRVSERTLKDTEGRELTATCDRQQRCALVRAAGPEAPPGLPHLVLHTPGRLVGLCDSASSAPPKDPWDCRPLVCRSDADCPPQHDAKDGKCLNGWCTDPANAVSVPDAVMLCLAGTGLGKNTKEQHNLYAMALNCGTPCTVPRTCRQP